MLCLDVATDSLDADVQREHGFESGDKDDERNQAEEGKAEPRADEQDSYRPNGKRRDGDNHPERAALLDGGSEGSVFFDPKRMRIMYVGHRVPSR